MRMSVWLTLPRDASWVPRVRGVAGCLLETAGTPADDVADLQLALTEACANVVRHAVGTDSYTVGLVVEPVGCEVEIVDFGPGFDETVLGGAGEDAETGRGLELMGALVDDLELRADAAATRLVLRKRWSAELDPGAIAAVDADSVTLTIDGLTAAGPDATDGDCGTVKARLQRSRPFRPGERDPAWGADEDGDPSVAQAGGSMPWARRAGAVTRATGPSAVSHT